MTFDDVKQKISESNKVLGFTGAGISTESEIPDFRSPGGVWSKYRTVFFQEFVANHEDRVEYWRQKVEGWPPIRDAVPNKGHKAFVDLHNKNKLLAVITQNIDGLHQKAGLPGDKVIELHGTTTEVTCLSCGDRIPMDEAVERVSNGEIAPECKECGGFLKPATVSFGQSLPENAMDLASRLCMECEVFIAVGSSLVVQPAASFPVLAKQSGSILVIINRTETPIDSIADLIINNEIGKVLPELVGSLVQ